MKSMLTQKLTKAEKSWILYDVGNSAFILLVSTIMPIYFNYLAGSAGLTDVQYLAYWGYAASAATLLVALMGPGHFTKGGHFILLRGVTLTGTLLVADPNSVERSLAEWEPQLILDELSSSTNNGAPLWVLSKMDD